MVTIKDIVNSIEILVLSNYLELECVFVIAYVWIKKLENKSGKTEHITENISSLLVPKIKIKLWFILWCSVLNVRVPKPILPFCMVGVGVVDLLMHIFWLC